MCEPSFLSASPILESWLSQCVWIAHIHTDIHSWRRSWSNAHNSSPAGRTKDMLSALLVKSIGFESIGRWIIDGMGDDNAASGREDPFVAFAKADAAVAFGDAGDGWGNDGKAEIATVAAAIVDLRRSWSYFRHDCCLT